MPRSPGLSEPPLYPPRHPRRREVYLSNCSVADHLSVSLCLLSHPDLPPDSRILLYSGHLTLDGGRGVYDGLEFRSRLTSAAVKGVHCVAAEPPRALLEALAVRGHPHGGAFVITHHAVSAWLDRGDGAGGIPPACPTRLRADEEAAAYEVYAICRDSSPANAFATALGPWRSQQGAVWAAEMAIKKLLGIQ